MWKDLLTDLGVIGIILAVMLNVVFGISSVTASDMFPSLAPGDLVLYYRLWEYRNSDIVVYLAGKELRLGRIQGVPGDRIGTTEDGELTINENIQPVQERKGLFFRTFYSGDGSLPCPSEVPDGTFLILGDQRDHALDSRSLGYIKKGHLKGKVLIVIRRRVT